MDVGAGFALVWGWPPIRQNCLMLSCFCCGRDCDVFAFFVVLFGSLWSEIVLVFCVFCGPVW